MNKGIVFQALASVSRFLTAKEKRMAIGNFFLLLFSSLLDVFGLASLVPVIIAASDPEVIKTNSYFLYVYDGIGFQSYQSFLIFLIVSVLVFFLVKNLFTLWINYKQIEFTAEIALKVVKKQYNKYLNIPYWHLQDLGSAGLMNKVGHIPAVYVTGIIRPLYLLFSDITMIAIIVFGILFYQPLLAVLLAVILIPTALLTYNALKNKSDYIGKRTNELRPEAQKLITNSFNGFVEFKLANRTEENKDKFIHLQKEVQGLEAKSFLFGLIPLKMIEMVAILGVVTIFLYAVLFPQISGSVIALVGLFAAAAYRLMPSVNRLMLQLMMIKQNHYLIRILDEFKEFDLTQSQKPEQKSLVFNHRVKFENISFAFPGTEKLVVQNINLEVKKGEKVGFIGASGSGKTTLMNILLRFYIENKGRILVDDEPLTNANIAAWYAMIGYVRQDTFLMEGTIEENITLGSPNVDHEGLMYAITYASLSEFVNSLPDGIHTQIGETGSKLSGGQKQRIGIARALYKKAEILVLDEATSALDNNTEREVSEAIDKLSDTNITIFMIAHRITTLRECDRIYELKNSKIVSEWSYQDLIKTVI